MVKAILIKNVKSKMMYYGRRFVPSDQNSYLQEEVANMLLKWRQRHPKRKLIYCDHYHFMDFSKFGAPMPYYFNQGGIVNESLLIPL